jgi:hypothetical protein
VPPLGFALGERGATSPICEAGKGWVVLSIFIRFLLRFLPVWKAYRQQNAEL